MDKLPYCAATPWPLSQTTPLRPPQKLAVRSGSTLPGPKKGAAWRLRLSFGGHHTPHYRFAPSLLGIFMRRPGYSLLARSNARTAGSVRLF